MPERTHQHDRTSEQDPSPFGKTVLEDLRVDFRRAMHQDLQDVYQFYLDPDTHDRLAEMGSVSRWLHMVFWVVKSSVLKLTSTRRLLLLASAFLFLNGLLGQINLVALGTGFLMLLLILLLELKDKLLAQDELATGRAVQFALLPKEQPDFPGWEIWFYTRPANDVGGDLIDYVPACAGRAGVAVGDVAGKGLGAALFMAKLQSTLRAIAPSHGRLSDLGREMNKIFCRDSLPGRFASLLYFELTPETGEVRVLNAGHHPPLVVRTTAVEELPKGGPALGILPEAHFSEQRLTVEPGTMLLAYSDGLTEARNEQGAFFGQHRLMRLLPQLRRLPVEAAGLCLLDEVDRFVGDARPSDDLSLILLRRMRPPHQEARKPTNGKAAVS